MDNFNKKVLIVDDDEFLLDMYSVKFRESGFTVDICQGGREALDKLKGGFRPDVILLDIVMPVMDGLELFQAAKKEQLLGDALVVILSNLGQKEDVEKGLNLGASDYIIKAHFTPSEVVRRILELLEKKS